MAETIGKRLREAREAKGLSVQDVAFETRMHVTSVQALELDDYSVFANTTYARSFLSIYCRYLDVDASDALEQFAGGRNVAWNSGTGLSVLQTVAEEGPPRERFFGGREREAAPARASSAPGFPIGITVIMVLVMAALGVIAYVGATAETPEEAQAKILDLAKKLPVKGGENAAASGGETTSQAPVPEPPAASSAPSVPDTTLAQVTPAAPSPELDLSGAPSAPVPAVSTAASDSPLLPPAAGKAGPSAPAPSVGAPSVAAPLRASPIVAVPVDPNAPPEPDEIEDAAPEPAPAPPVVTPPAAVVPKKAAPSKSTNQSSGTRSSNATPAPAPAPEAAPKKSTGRLRDRSRNPGTAPAGGSNFVDPNSRFPRVRQG